MSARAREDEKRRAVKEVVKINERSLVMSTKLQLRILILGVGTIMAWRGVWRLADALLLPSNLVMSSVVSILVGLLIFALIGEIRLTA